MASGKALRIAKEKLAVTKVLFVGWIVLLVTASYELTPVHAWVESKLALPLYFKARERLGKAPSLHPKLKIFSYDDTTFSRLQATHLDLQQWTTILTALDQRRPKAIFIDQIFALVPPHRGLDADASPVERAAAEGLLARLAALQTPVVSVASVTPDRVAARPPLDLEAALYRLETYFASLEAIFWRFPPLADRRGFFAYGPTETLRPVLRQVGHGLNAGHGQAQALLSLSPRSVVPHMAFLGTGGLEIDAGRLWLDGVELPLSAKGDVFVDFSSPVAYYTAHKRVAKLLADAESGRPVASVDEGDFVLILPAMYTGHSDFTQTPIGDLPGGFVIASLLSSRLRGRWLSESALQPVVDGAAIALGALAGLVSGALYAPALLAALGAWLAFCVYVFAWHGSVVALGSSVLALTATALTLLALRSRLRERLVLVLKLLKRENEELQLELSQAADIARVLLPSKVPEWPDVSIGAFHRSLTDTSGDWFAFERAPSGGYLHFVLCDISGHGAQAAIIVSTCKAVLSMLVETDARLLERADFLPLYATHLNRTLCRNGAGSHTTTLLGLTLEVAAEKVHCICAAHPLPLHFQGDDASSLRPIGKVNNLLGVSLDHGFSAKSYDLRPGDNLVAFTDGVLLPRRLDQIRATFHRYAHHTPEAAARYAALEGWETKTHATGARINDDISLIWLRYRGKTARALPKVLKAS